MANLSQRLQRLESRTPVGASDLDRLLWKVYKGAHPELNLPDEPSPPYCTKSFEELLAEVRGRNAKH